MNSFSLPIVAPITASVGDFDSHGSPMIAMIGSVLIVCVMSRYSLAMFVICGVYQIVFGLCVLCCAFITCVYSSVSLIDLGLYVGAG